MTQNKRQRTQNVYLTNEHNVALSISP